METPLVVAVVGILGIFIGALLQFYFGRRIELSKQFKLLQTQAYVDFLKGVAGVAKAQEFGNKERELEYIIFSVRFKVTNFSLRKFSSCEKISRVFSRLQ